MGTECCSGRENDKEEYRTDYVQEKPPSPKRLKKSVKSKGMNINPESPSKPIELAVRPSVGLTAVFYPMYLVREYKGSMVESLYDTMEVIGRGSYGEVRKVKCKRTGCTRVMKKILKQKGSEDDKVLDEIQILRKLVRISEVTI